MGAWERNGSVGTGLVDVVPTHLLLFIQDIARDNEVKVMPEHCRRPCAPEEGRAMYIPGVVDVGLNIILQQGLLLDGVCAQHRAGTEGAERTPDVPEAASELKNTLATNESVESIGIGAQPANQCWR